VYFKIGDFTVKRIKAKAQKKIFQSAYKDKTKKAVFRYRLLFVSSKSTK